MVCQRTGTASDDRSIRSNERVGPACGISKDSLADPAGQELLVALARSSDVLVENFKVGAAARFGIDYASINKVNPRLVYCSITGFGQSGPYALRAGYDAMIQGMGGLMSITGRPDGVPGGGPQKVGVAMVDLTTGLYAVIAILAALQQRERISDDA